MEAIFPLNSIRVHVVNEAFSTLQGWAEGSLRVADRVLNDYFNVPRPWSFNVTDLNQIVSQTSSDTTCPAGSSPSSGNSTNSTTGEGGGGGGGGDSGGGDSGGGNTDDGDPLCFTSSALVQMADGLVVPISTVKEGDIVETGFGNGRVTKFLKHDVYDIVNVAVITTQMGDLVGTSDHPIYVGGKWYEINDAVLFGLVNVTMQSKYVDAFYNLEVDGHIISSSLSHSYIVNGIIASGLGDNVYLNQIHKRQKSWHVYDKSLQLSRMQKINLYGATEIK